MRIPLKPSKILESNGINYEFFKKQDYFVVTVNIFKLKKHRTFSTTVQQIKIEEDYNNNSKTVIIDN